MTALLLAALAVDASAPVCVFDPASCGLLRTIAPLGGELRGAAFTRDGGRLVVGFERGARIYETARWTELRRLAEPPETLVSLALHPDGRVAAGGGLEGTITVWDLETGGVLRNFKGHAASVSALAFAPGGAALLSGSHDASLRIWDWTLGAESARLPWAEGPVLAAAASPDGRRWAAAGDGGAVRLWNAATREEERTVRIEGCASLEFARDGRLLAGGARSLSILGPDGLRDCGAAASAAAAFLPDGRHVVSGAEDESLRLVDLRGGAVTVLRHHTAPVSAVAVDPRGRFVVTLGRDRHMKVWGPRPGGMSGVGARGYLGINIQEADGTVSVASVFEGTAAAAAGLRAGDVIRRVGGAEPRSVNDCVDAISSHLEGEEVEFAIVREGAARTERIRLGRRPGAR